MDSYNETKYKELKKKYAILMKVYIITYNIAISINLIRI